MMVTNFFIQFSKWRVYDFLVVTLTTLSIVYNIDYIILFSLLLIVLLCGSIYFEKFYVSIYFEEFKDTFSSRCEFALRHLETHFSYGTPVPKMVWY